MNPDLRSKVLCSKIDLLHIIRHRLKHHLHNSFCRGGVVVHKPLLRHADAPVTIQPNRVSKLSTQNIGIQLFYCDDLIALAYDKFNSNGAGYQRMIDATPMRRVGSSDEIGAAGASLLSDAASYVTGTDLLVDSGTEVMF